MEQKNTYRVEDNAALAAFAAWSRNFNASANEWAAGGTPGMDPDIAAAQAELSNLCADPYANIRNLAAAKAHHHHLCLAVAECLASARQVLLARVRGFAAETQAQTAKRVFVIALRAYRALADLASRLHGLSHICLVAVRVSTAQVIPVAN